MHYIIRQLTTSTRFPVAALGILLPLSATADDEDLRAGDIEPRTGIVSDEVVLRKLQVLGADSAEIVRRDPDRIEVQGEINFILDPVTGELLETEQSAPAVLPLTTHLESRDPVISDRAAIADPGLMNGAVLIGP